ncbi:hypothetical protein T01_11756 [Trichinella spiralis]|uniref:Uncharacterized protein n=1 Tax=Trichinella spiralis TaxID=6334 RepID=A0A0V0YWR1_TRISP|nr:hypothetical protein T01_11756 [Trichinella spiralis]
MTFYDGSKASLVNEFDNEESYAAIIMSKFNLYSSYAASEKFFTDPCI